MGVREDVGAKAVVTGEVATAAAVRAARKEVTGREEAVRVLAGLEQAVAEV